MISETRLSVVIPTRNSSRHISETLQAVITQVASFEWLQIVVVDDASSDNTSDVAERTLDNSPDVSYIVIELAKNLGQSSATAIGMSHSRGDILVTLDDDLSYPPTEIPRLVKALTGDLDFVVGAPSNYPNSRTRELASRLTRWLGVRAFETPRDFQFSSFAAYRREFIMRVDLPNCRVDEIGWMFQFTQRYANTTIETSAGLRNESNYGVHALCKAAKPLIRPIIQRLSRVVRRISFLLALAAAMLAMTYFLRSTFGEELLPGFPTLAVILLVNLSFAGVTLSLAISILIELHGQRRTSTFQTQRHCHVRD